MRAIPYLYNDGGRRDAGYKGKPGDCVIRAIAIALELPYQKVYDDLENANLDYMIDNSDAKAARIRAKGASPRDGNYKEVYRPYLESKGWEWVPLMRFGTGCQVHLKASELPMGRIIVRLSRHLAAVIDRVLYDTHDSSRAGTRCVYGYYRKKEQP